MLSDAIRSHGVPCVMSSSSRVSIATLSKSTPSCFCTVIITGPRLNSRRCGNRARQAKNVPHHPPGGWTNSRPSCQDIELMCEGDNLDCGHLFQGGAMNTIVRLPDNVRFGFAVGGLDLVV